jgi:allophanate hydrolase subunit 2
LKPAEKLTIQDVADDLAVDQHHWLAQLRRVGQGAGIVAQRVQDKAFDPISRLADGDVLSIGQPAAGARSYVAARGGFAIASVLGSCATDTRAGVGPAPLAVGDVLGLRPTPAGAVVSEPALPAADLPTLEQEVLLDVVMGPRTDWFTPQAVARVATQRWQVTPQSNRVGLRLAGDAPLELAIGGELPSAGTALGALQVLPSGQPVLFLADHPLTGGYPVIATVAPYHLDRAGQIPVGAWLRFNPIRAFEELSPAAAQGEAGTFRDLR